MEKIMFDANAFSSLLNSNADWTNFFSKCEGKYEFYVTALQIEELSETPDSKKLDSNICCVFTKCGPKWFPIYLCLVMADWAWRF